MHGTTLGIRTRRSKVFGSSKSTASDSRPEDAHAVSSARGTGSFCGEATNESLSPVLKLGPVVTLGGLTSGVESTMSSYIYNIVQIQSLDLATATLRQIGRSIFVAIRRTLVSVGRPERRLVGTPTTPKP